MEKIQELTFCTKTRYHKQESRNLCFSYHQAPWRNPYFLLLFFRKSCPTKWYITWNPYFLHFLEKAASLNGTLPINVHYPVISKNGSVQYTNAHQQEVPIMYPGHHRPAPLFGGRMTDQRLTEVKTITKNTIEQLHQYAFLFTVSWNYQLLISLSA